MHILSIISCTPHGVPEAEHHRNYRNAAAYIRPHNGGAALLRQRSCSGCRSHRHSREFSYAVAQSLQYVQEILPVCCSFHCDIYAWILCVSLPGCACYFKAPQKILLLNLSMQIYIYGRLGVYVLYFYLVKINVILMSSASH